MIYPLFNKIIYIRLFLINNILAFIYKYVNDPRNNLMFHPSFEFYTQVEEYGRWNKRLWKFMKTNLKWLLSIIYIFDSIEPRKWSIQRKNLTIFYSRDENLLIKYLYKMTEEQTLRTRDSFGTLGQECSLAFSKDLIINFHQVRKNID